MPTAAKNTHSAGISAHLARAGFEKYRPDKNSGYTAAKWWDQEPYVVALRMRYLGRKSQSEAKHLADMAACLDGLGFVTKQGWDANGHVDPSVVLVSKQPFLAPYEEQAELAVDPEATMEQLCESIASILNQGKQLSATPAKDGFVMHAADGAPYPAVYLTWSPAKGLSNEDQLVLGRSKVVTYYKLLQGKLPTALLSQDGDPYGCIMVAAHRDNLVATYSELIEFAWERAVAAVAEVQDHPPVTEAEVREVAEAAPMLYDSSVLLLPAPPQEAVSASLAAVQKSLEGRPVPSEIQSSLEVLERALTAGITVQEGNPLWEAVQDLFLDPESAAAAVREIGNEHTAARDDAASTMERRLYHQALLAIAAGSPDAQMLAHTVLETQHLFFNRQ